MLPRNLVVVEAMFLRWWHILAACAVPRSRMRRPRPPAVLRSSDEDGNVGWNPGAVSALIERPKCGDDTPASTADIEAGVNAVWSRCPLRGAAAAPHAYRHPTATTAVGGLQFNPLELIRKPADQQGEPSRFLKER